MDSTGSIYITIEPYFCFRNESSGTNIGISFLIIYTILKIFAMGFVIHEVYLRIIGYTKGRLITARESSLTVFISQVIPTIGCHVMGYKVVTILQIYTVVF